MKDIQENRKLSIKKPHFDKRSLSLPINDDPEQEIEPEEPKSITEPTTPLRDPKHVKQELN